MFATSIFRRGVFCWYVHFERFDVYSIVFLFGSACSKFGRSFFADTRSERPFRHRFGVRDLLVRDVPYFLKVPASSRPMQCKHHTLNLTCYSVKAKQVPTVNASRQVSTVQAAHGALFHVYVVLIGSMDKYRYSRK